MTPLTIEDARALPALNGPDVIMRLFQIQKSRFHQLDGEGAFDFLKVVPGVGPKRFSGAKIAAYAAGEIVGRSFGGSRRHA